MVHCPLKALIVFSWSPKLRIFHSLQCTFTVQKQTTFLSSHLLLFINKALPFDSLGMTVNSTVIFLVICFLVRKRYLTWRKIDRLSCSQLNTTINSPFLTAAQGLVFLAFTTVITDISADLSRAAAGSPGALQAQVPRVKKGFALI